jgi:hypothetical protein
MMLAPLHLGWLYAAYLIFGIAQGGSHLIWHLSGPIFSEAEESSRYSGVNVLMVGIRGLIAPILGGILNYLFGADFVFVLGGLCCLGGFFYLFNQRNFKIP